MCRRFGVQVKELSDNRIVVQCNVGTLAVDGKTVEDYFREGSVADLAEMIHAKRSGRSTRNGKPVAVRALQQFPAGGVQAVDLTDIDEILGAASLSADNQKKMAAQGQFSCSAFPNPPLKVPGSELRLILDSQITSEEHGETILDPVERISWMLNIRNFLNGADAMGSTILFSDAPITASSQHAYDVLPPTIRIMGRNKREILVQPPRDFSERSLSERARNRAENVRRNGFLLRRPINPALAFPKHLGNARAARLKADLESIWQQQGIYASFGVCLYGSVEDIYRFIEEHNHDSVLAVLPEGSDSATDSGTHERLKRRLEVPSQCIQHNHTLPNRLVSAKVAEIDPRLWRRLTQRYDLCLANLLVKHHWFPFAPSEPFNYNIQVGLDVGGVHNSVVMSCLGYGFKNPSSGMFFLPDEIPVDVAKKEPIPTDALFKGLLALFEKAYTQLSDLSMPIDFSTAIFYRDGQLLGDGDAWNELDALKRLQQELVRRCWIVEDSTWTAVEVMKAGHGWRLLRNSAGYHNPVVGQCVFPFTDSNIGLVATTGAPYLTQGTAQPLCIRVHDISGNYDRKAVISDLVWQADMCFTKVDMGMSLPWVLNVADTGALQLAKSYLITGITA